MVLFYTKICGLIKKYLDKQRTESGKSTAYTISRLVWKYDNTLVDSTFFYVPQTPSRIIMTIQQGCKGQRYIAYSRPNGKVTSKGHSLTWNYPKNVTAANNLWEKILNTVMSKASTKGAVL
jgi:hypothetical protein